MERAVTERVAAVQHRGWMARQRGWADRQTWMVRMVAGSMRMGSVGPCWGGSETEVVENNMKRVASSDQELTVEECNLLCVAYKNVIGAHHASWRIVSSIEQKEESQGNEQQVAMIKGYWEWIESKLAKICEDILDVPKKHLIPSAASRESKVFHHKMQV